MKRLVLFLLMLQMLTANAFGRELGRLPFLFQHFLEHSERQGLDFADFLRLHYGDTPHEQSDPDTHNSLPLKDGIHHAPTLNLATVMPQPPLPHRSETGVVQHFSGLAPKSQTLRPSDDDLDLRERAESIFQPPRF